ncbi:hypothetical protein F4801DRAFT_52969 [Xylaria longipes]|nr:hypothetical protein F4801DRAFT_52969 [Xylaria longipes]
MPPHPPLHYSGKKWWTVALQDTPGPGPDTTHIARQCSSIKTTPVVRIANMSESSGNVPLSRHHPDFDRVKDTITCSEFRDTLWGFVLYRYTGSSEATWQRMLRALCTSVQ